MKRSFPILFFALSACMQEIIVPFHDVEKMAISQLALVQEQSIQEEREYCGWIWMRGSVLEASPVKAGHEDGCNMVIPPLSTVVLASFHTHGSHDPEYLSEAPSVLDVKGDYADQTLGYVSTPGGRIWRIDPFHGEISIICDLDCLPRDPNYHASEVPPLPKRMNKTQFLAYSELYTK